MQAAAIPSPMVDPFRLTESEKQRLDNILGFWETRSSKVKTYSCDFTRLDYDAVFGPAIAHCQDQERRDHSLCGSR